MGVFTVTTRISAQSTKSFFSREGQGEVSAISGGFGWHHRSYAASPGSFSGLTPISDLHKELAEAMAEYLLSTVEIIEPAFKPEKAGQRSR